MTVSRCLSLPRRFGQGCCDAGLGLHSERTGFGGMIIAISFLSIRAHKEVASFRSCRAIGTHHRRLSLRFESCYVVLEPKGPNQSLHSAPFHGLYTGPIPRHPKHVKRRNGPWRFLVDLNLKSKIK